MSFTVTRTGVATMVSSVDWSLGYDTAIDNDITGTTSGTLTFAAGETEKTVNVTVVGDLTPEQAETFYVNLSNFIEIDDLVDIQGTGTIANDDSSFAIVAGDPVEEGAGQVFTITRSHDTVQDQTINWNVVFNSDADSVDMTGMITSGSVTFEQGEMSKEVTVYSFDDTTSEFDENFSVEISLGAGTEGDIITAGSALGTILNNDAGYRITADQVSMEEGNGTDSTFTFTVTRSGDTTGESTVDWRLASAAADTSDFITGDMLGDNSGLPSGTVSFAGGESSKTITISVSGDTDVEADELFTVNLSNSSDGLILVSSAESTIVNDDASISIAAQDAVKVEGDSGLIALTFTVTRTGALAESETVDWSVNGSGTNPADAADFGGALPGGTLTLPAGQADTTLTVYVSGDTLAEANETFQVTLTNPSTGVTIDTATADGTILTDDTNYFISRSDTEVVEGDPGDTSVFTFEITREGDVSTASTVSWSVAGIGSSAALAADFETTVGSVTFAAGETVKTVQVPIAEDINAENDETFQVTLSSSDGATFTTNTVNGTIVDDDVYLSITADDPQLFEGAPGETTTFSFTVERTGGLTSPVDVDWNVLASGNLDPNDFVSSTLPSGTVHFDIGQTIATIEVQVSGDVAIESEELLTVQISNATGGAQITTDQASSAILADDIEWSITPTTIPTVEGDTTAQYVYTVTRNGSEQAVTIDWSVSGSGTDPVNGADFSAGFLPSGTLAFAQGEMTKEIIVEINGDYLVENDESFTIGLTPSGADAFSHLFIQQSVETTVYDDDDVITLNSADISDIEDTGIGVITDYTYTVSRTGNLAGKSSAVWQVVHGSTDGSDFVATSGTVTFGDGEDQATITVQVIGDSDVEADESFTVLLSSAGAGSTLGAGTATGEIINDDTDFTFEPVVDSVYEGDLTGGQLRYRVLRTGFLGQAASISWALAGAVNAADFEGALSGTVNFEVGETEKLITLDVTPDGDNEGDESFAITLSNPSAGTEIVNSTLSGTILNDDDSLFIEAVDADKEEGDSDLTPFTFLVTRSGSFRGEATVRWTVTGSGTNPASDDDFDDLTGTITLADGESSQLVTVNVVADSLGENDEEFIVTLSDPSFGSTIIGDAATGVIRNDDPAISISPAQQSIEEGDSGIVYFTYTVTRTGDLSGTSSVDWHVEQTGDHPVQALDFGGAYPSGIVVFNAGESEKTILVAVAGDTTGEYDEGFMVVLSDNVNCEIVDGVAESVIINDDTGFMIEAEGAVSEIVQPEGAEGEITYYTYLVTLTGPSTGNNSVDWRVSGNGEYWADADDFVAGQDGLGDNNDIPSGTLVFAEGETQKSIVIGIEGDDSIGELEGFKVTLENPVGGSIIQDVSYGVVTNDDSSYSITGQDTPLVEGDFGETTTFDFDIWRTGNTSTDSYISWRVVGFGENPADGDDFAGGSLPSGTINFAAGESNQVLSIDVTGDFIVEPEESFRVELYGAAPNSTVSYIDATATGSIESDDIGTAEDDILTGTGASEELTGMGGDDLLTGGGGADRFVYTSPSDGTDTITDFETGVDQIVLANGSFGTLGSGSGTTSVSQNFDTDVNTTLDQLSAQEDADFYKVDFGTGNFIFDVGEDGNLDELEAALTSGDHTGSATIAVSNGNGSTHIYYDEDTSIGTDGSGLQEIVEVEEVADATTLADDSVEAQIVG